MDWVCAQWLALVRLKYVGPSERQTVDSQRYVSVSRLPISSTRPCRPSLICCCARTVEREEKREEFAADKVGGIITCIAAVWILGMGVDNL